MSFRSLRTSLTSFSTLFRLGAVQATALALVFAGAVGAAACAQGVSGGKANNDSGTISGDDSTGDNGDDTVSDSGVLGDDGSNISTTDGGDGDTDPGDQDGGGNADGGTTEGGTSTGNDGGTPAGACTSIASGDLIVVELMIESQMAATGDTGQWVEILNTRQDCSIVLKNITVTSPRSSGMNDTATINDGRVLAPGGTFVVAESTSASVNHNLPSPVYAFANSPSDVLSRSGDTVTVAQGTTVLDSFTYASSTFNVGSSFAFSTECPASDRSSFAHWSIDSASATPTVYYQGTSMNYYGTPNAPNNDVTCN